MRSASGGAEAVQSCDDFSRDRVQEKIYGEGVPSHLQKAVQLATDRLRRDHTRRDQTMDVEWLRPAAGS